MINAEMKQVDKCYGRKELLVICVMCVKNVLA